MAKKRQTKKSRKNTKKKDLFVMIGSIALTVVLVVTMILNAPIIDYRTSYPNRLLKPQHHYIPYTQQVFPSLL